MPQKPSDYSKTQIYKLVCNDTNVKETYIGHTTCWRIRKSNHKRSCNIPELKDYNCKLYQIIRSNGGWDNWSMIEIEKYPCEDKRMAESRERYWIEQTGNIINQTRPIITREESLERKRNYQRIKRAINKAIDD